MLLTPESFSLFLGDLRRSPFDVTTPAVSYVRWYGSIYTSDNVPPPVETISVIIDEDGLRHEQKYFGQVTHDTIFTWHVGNVDGNNWKKLRELSRTPSIDIDVGRLCHNGTQKQNRTTGYRLSVDGTGLINRQQYPPKEINLLAKQETQRLLTLMTQQTLFFHSDLT